jgi:putative nucleotidyltransferase with HDIG domain
MRFAGRFSGLARLLILGITMVFTAIVLVVGQTEPVEQISLLQGQPSPQTFIAPRRVTVVDQDATDALRQQASGAVAERYSEDAQTTAAVLDSIQLFFSNVREAAEPLIIDIEDPTTITPPTTTTTSTTTTTTTVPTDETSTTVEGGETTTTAGSETTATGDTTAEGEDGTTTTTEPPTTTTTEPPTTTTTTMTPPPPRQLQISELRTLHPLVNTETITIMVDIINDDWQRVQDGEGEIFRFVEDEALSLARDLLEDGIKSTELEGIRASLVTDPRELILLRDLPSIQRQSAEAGVADLVATSLQANEIFDLTATEQARQDAAAQVTDVTVGFFAGEAIVREGERVTSVEIQAIEELGLLDVDQESPRLTAMALVAALSIFLLAITMRRVGEEFWQQPKLVGLLGMLIVLAAVVSRIPEVITRDTIELGFLLPASLFGYLAASLFDARVAALMAVPVATFTGLATGDLGLAVYAVGATLAPVPLVSSISSRSELNAAVVLTSALLAPLAGAISWFFSTPGANHLLAALFGAAGGVAAGVAALGVLPFLASLFGITTTQTLLDLTDRNHPGLRLIEEQAPGTFNHSIMVGNLAGKAARTIGGNPLLAQAMAYYHDLGKTTNAKYFVENQFGVSNPHDRLPPEESAALIRSHVAEGLRLAREYRIPPDVAQGILTHHGTSLMRFFYHKAIDIYGDGTNPVDYRHRGRKPKSKEMVIVMLADACEAATRSLVQHEDPTSESLRTLVESIIAEKVEDGQLEESDVTFGELTRVKEAFVDALIGYYHTRIPYPGFPGPKGTEGP